ncbi:hypothetical protein DFH06DRAFT_1130521 [Mycena polygramma]|nr:hypothetical protein DFH06DRAFT_1130521 [Mycena polygramma]
MQTPKTGLASRTKLYNICDSQDWTGKFVIKQSEPFETQRPAVCSISEDNSVAWLGKPIDLQAGNERLEPTVMAFPVANTSDPPLSIITGETIGLRQHLLKRDAYTLYNNEEMKGLKILAYWTVFALVILSTIVTVRGRHEN